MKRQFGTISRLKNIEAKMRGLIVAALEEIACCLTPGMLKPVAIKARRRAANIPHPMGHHRLRNTLGEER
jgi:hypothetical protein